VIITNGTKYTVENGEVKHVESATSFCDDDTVDLQLNNPTRKRNNSGLFATSDFDLTTPPDSDDSNSPTLTKRLDSASNLSTNKKDPIILPIKSIKELMNNNELKQKFNIRQL
jgi:hypothetical protein